MVKGLTDYNTEVCDNLTQAYKNSCNNQIVLAESLDKKDVKICDKLIVENDERDYEKEFCIQEIAYIIEEENQQEIE